jgi:hypothetical protein
MLDPAFIARDEAVYKGTWETGNNTDCRICRTANIYLTIEKKLRSMFKSTLGLHAAALHIRKVG